MRGKGAGTQSPQVHAVGAHFSRRFSSFCASAPLSLCVNRVRLKWTRLVHSKTCLGFIFPVARKLQLASVLDLARRSSDAPSKNRDTTSLTHLSLLVTLSAFVHIMHPEATMSADDKKHDKTARLEKRLDKLQAAQRRQFLNEDIVRLEKDGSVSRETVRTVATRADGTIVDQNGKVLGHKDSVPSENPANSNLLPDKLPETPESQEIGNLSACSSP